MAGKQWTQDDEIKLWNLWQTRGDKNETTTAFGLRVGSQFGVSADGLRAKIVRMQRIGGLTPGREVEKTEPLTDLEQRCIDALKKKKKVWTLESLCNLLDRSPSTINQVLDHLKVLGYQVETALTESGEPKAALVRDPRPTYRVHTHDWFRETVRFAQIGDTHCGSKVARMDFLHEFYAICKHEGIDTVYHAGDLLAGHNVYKGQEYELEDGCLGFDGQCQYVAKHYPQIEGITTYWICGNHDLSFVKSMGANPGLVIPQMRPDLQYLGDIEADVIIGKDHSVRHRIFHPHVGKNYSDDYKPKRIIEGLPGGTKPNSMVFGHWHCKLWSEMRSVQFWLAGTFEGQSSFFRSKGWQPALGGWIIEYNISPQGGINRIKSEFIPFYWEPLS